MRFKFVHALSASLVAVLAITTATSSDAARRRPEVRNSEPTATPEIRTTAANKVPACVTPAGLTSVLTERNAKLEERFKTIAGFYKQHGETLNIRWDYAFYQMVLETNYLMFMRGNGKPGDVRSKQNNFAGIGATGGGVPGESYPDVSTGVLAQLQHLVAYSGERVANPVAPRTRENQDTIIAKSKQLGRAVRFGDLTNRWAADRNYAASVTVVAERFQSAICNGAAVAAAAATAAPVASPAGVDEKASRRRGRGRDVANAPAAVKPEPAAAAAVEAPAVAEAAPLVTKPRGRDLARKAIDDSKTDNASKAALGGAKLAAPALADGCAVMAASFGGSVTLLIRAATPKGVNFTALGVEGGNEQAMADSYMKEHADGGRVLARFKTRDEAVAHAYDLCDSGKP